MIRSYRSAIVANSPRTYCRLPSTVAIRDRSDIRAIIAPAMFQSSTVENYLKAIYQGQLALPSDVRLVSMGQVASALGVTPGTATTMVTIG